MRRLEGRKYVKEFFKKGFKDLEIDLLINRIRDRFIAFIFFLNKM